MAPTWTTMTPEWILSVRYCLLGNKNGQEGLELAARLPCLRLCINSLLDWLFQPPFSNHGAPSLGLVSQPRVDFQTLYLRPPETLTLPHIFGKGTWKKTARSRRLRVPRGLTPQTWLESLRPASRPHLWALLFSGASSSPSPQPSCVGCRGFKVAVGWEPDSQICPPQTPGLPSPGPQGLGRRSRLYPHSPCGFECVHDRHLSTGMGS